jgi:polar amino acid transport system substrate-binding protein
MTATFAGADAETSPQATVTIFTDGIARPDGRVSKALTEMARMLANDKTVRPLPVMGYDGVSNVNDLLHSRGVEFAILNSDIFAYLDIAKAHPDAKRKIRYVTRLYSQKAYLLARKGIASLDQLEGKSLGLMGPESSTEVTARTVFALAGVKPDIRRFSAAADDGGMNAADALFLLESDLAGLPASLVQSGAFNLIDIPVNEKLAAIYRSTTTGAGEAGSERTVTTITVDTVMAIFDWAPNHVRYGDVTRFMNAFFAALPKLREDYPASIWTETDPHASVAGWKRYHHAEKIKGAVPQVVPTPTPAAGRLIVAARQPAAVPPSPAKAPAPSKAEQEQAAIDPFGTDTETVAPAPDAKMLDAASGPALRLSIVASPPLTDASAPGGGLISELTMAVAKHVNGDGVTTVWNNDQTAQIEELVVKRGASIGIPWETPNCDEPQFLGAQNATMCDGALFSEPLFQVPVVFFGKAGGNFSFETDASVTGRVLCLPVGRDLADIGEKERKWVENNKVTLRRPATTIDCLSMVERGEADALVGSEPETRFIIERLGLSEGFKMAERPLATRGVHIVIGKGQPDADALLTKINAGIGALKQSGDYAAIVAKHLPSFMPGAIAKVE